MTEQEGLSKESPSQEIRKDVTGPGPRQFGKEVGPSIPEIVRKAFVAIILLLIFIATLQLYFGVQDVIRTWFADEMIPVVNGLFYLCIIVGGVYLIRTYLIRGQ
jgi:hypothetical protein